MNCRSAKRGHNCVDEIVRDGELSQFEAHQLECESCELQSSDLRAIRSALQMLPPASPPEGSSHASACHRFAGTPIAA